MLPWAQEELYPAQMNKLTSFLHFSSKLEGACMRGRGKRQRFLFPTDWGTTGQRIFGNCVSDVQALEIVKGET